jgi:hypothetical protein
MIETWDIIVKERKSGYDHRKPKKREKKVKKVKKTEEPIVFNNDGTDISSDNFNFSYLSQQKNNKIIIKINTETI